MGFLRYYRNAEQKSYYIKHCQGQSHAFRKHAHQEYSIALVTQGESCFRFIEDEFHIQKGQLVVIGPNVAHQCIPKCVAEWHFYMLHIAPAWIKETGFDCDGLPDFAITDLREDAFNQIEQWFERACEHVEDAVENIILIMESAFSLQLIRETESPCNNSEALILETVYEDIRARFKETITLEELAQKSGLDQYTLIRRFYRKYNTTPHAWQIMLRVDAARLLLENGQSISEAALEVGFYDQSHFTKLFKETYGVTPKQFIQSSATGVAAELATEPKK